jgi:hypothetical protein
LSGSSAKALKRFSQTPLTGERHPATTHR